MIDITKYRPKSAAGSSPSFEELVQEIYKDQRDLAALDRIPGEWVDEKTDNGLPMSDGRQAAGVKGEAEKIKADGGLPMSDGRLAGHDASYRPGERSFGVGGGYESASVVDRILGRLGLMPDQAAAPSEQDVLNEVARTRPDIFDKYQKLRKDGLAHDAALSVANYDATRTSGASADPRMRLSKFGVPVKDWPKAENETLLDKAAETKAGKRLGRGIELFNHDVGMFDAIFDSSQYAQRKKEKSAFEKEIERDPAKGENWFTETGLATAEMLGPIAAGVHEGQKVALPAGLAGVAAGSVTGPGAGVTGSIAAVAGGTAGTVTAWYKMGAGMLYDALRSEGIDHDMAAPLALAGGIPYAAIEYSQVGRILDWVPGLKKMFPKMLANSIKKVALGAATKYGKDVAVNTAEEVVQKGVELATIELGKAVQNEQGGEHLRHISWGDVGKQLWDEGIHAIGPMAFLGLPGATIHTSMAGKQVHDVRKAGADIAERTGLDKKTAKAVGQQVLDDFVASENETDEKKKRSFAEIVLSRLTEAHQKKDGERETADGKADVGSRIADEKTKADARSQMPDEKTKADEKADAGIVGRVRNEKVEAFIVSENERLDQMEESGDYDDEYIAAMREMLHGNTWLYIANNIDAIEEMERGNDPSAADYADEKKELLALKDVVEGKAVSGQPSAVDEGRLEQEKEGVTQRREGAEEEKAKNKEPLELAEYPELKEKAISEQGLTISDVEKGKKQDERSETQENPYLRMPMDRVRQDANNGVFLAKEALKIRGESEPIKKHMPDARFVERVNEAENEETVAAVEKEFDDLLASGEYDVSGKYKMGFRKAVKQAKERLGETADDKGGKREVTGEAGGLADYGAERQPIIEKAREKFRSGLAGFGNRDTLIADRENSIRRMIDDRELAGLIEWVGNTDNSFTREFFSAYTGIALPRNQRDTIAVLREFVGKEKAAEYDAKQAAEKQAYEARKEDQKHAEMIAVVEKKKYKDNDGVVISAKELIDRELKKANYRTETYKIGAIPHVAIVVDEKGRNYSFSSRHEKQYIEYVVRNYKADARSQMADEEKKAGEKGAGEKDRGAEGLKTGDKTVDDAGGKREVRIEEGGAVKQEPIGTFADPVADPAGNWGYETVEVFEVGNPVKRPGETSGGSWNVKIVVPSPLGKDKTQVRTMHFWDKKSAQRFIDTIYKSPVIRVGDMVKTKPGSKITITGPVKVTWEQGTMLKTNITGDTQLNKVDFVKVESGADKEEQDVRRETRVVDVLMNEAQGGVELKFAEKPSADVVSEVKANGFRWSMRNKVWYKKRTEQAVRFAEGLAERLNRGSEIGEGDSGKEKDVERGAKSEKPMPDARSPMADEFSWDEALAENNLKYGDFVAKKQRNHTIEGVLIENPIKGEQPLVRVTSPSFLSQEKWDDGFKKVKTEKAESGEKSTEYGAKNVLVSQERAAELERRIREKLKNLNVGVDPEFLALGTEYAVYHIEAGTRKFVDFARKMVETFGDAIRPFLRSMYLGARHYPGLDNSGMDSERVVEGVDVETIGKESAYNETENKEKPDETGKSGRQTGTTGTEGTTSVSPGGNIEGRAGERKPGSERSDKVVRDSEFAIGAGVPGAEVSTGTEQVEGQQAAGGISEAVRGAGNEPVVPGATDIRGEKPTTEPRVVQNYSLREKESPRLTKGQRNSINSRVKEILSKQSSDLTDDDKDILRQYTGEGGLSSGTKEALNQHYTDYDTIRAIYNALEKAGFKPKTALEPSVGGGNFVGNWPELAWTTIDIDETNHKVVSALYPQGKHYHLSFEDFVDSGYDFVVSNVPFSEERGAGRLRNRPDIKTLHDFYFIHALDRVRDDGIVAFISSHYTMDKLDKKTRKEITSKADIIGAFRLPQGHFTKTAHTDVMVDIIFMQKRPDGVEARPEMAENNAAFEIVDTQENGLKINSYYNLHPENILGELVEGVDKLYGGKPMYVVEGEARLDDISVDYTPYLKEKQKEKDKQKEGGIPESYHDLQGWMEENPNVMVKQNVFLPMGKDKDGNEKYYHSVDSNFEMNILFSSGQIYVMDKYIPFNDLHNGFAKIYKPLTGELYDKIDMLNRIKNAATEFQEMGDSYDSELGIGLINDYKNQFKTPPIADKKLHGFFKMHKEMPLFNELTSTFNENFEPADVFKERVRHTGSGRKEATKDSPLIDRAIASEDNKGFIHIADADLIKDSEFQELLKNGYSVVEFGDKTVVQNDILYYSGFVYDKIKMAQAILDKWGDDGTVADKLKKQIAELERVRPDALPIDEIDFRGNETWIHPLIENKGWFTARQVPDKNKQLHWVHDDDIYEKYLNNHVLVSRKWFDDGSVEPMGSYMARMREAEEHLYEIKQSILNNVKEDAALVEQIEFVYNSKFNGYVKPNYRKAIYLIQDVLNEIEANSPIRLRKNQIEWIIKAFYEGKGINAHDVGGGKTFASIALARVLKKRGAAKKPMFVVPAKTIKKWERDIKTLFPDAKIINLGNLSKDQRTKKLFDLSNTNADYVLISHEGFAHVKLPVDDELRFINAVVLEHLDDPGIAGRKYALLLEKIERYVSAIRNMPRDTRLTFDKLGIDMLVADEAHAFKNIGIRGELNKFGLGIAFGFNASGKDETNVTIASARSYDFRFKANYIAERNNNSNVFMLTATPTPNKPMEIYTMMRHMDYQILDEYGVGDDRSFANMFFNLGTVEDPEKHKPKSILRSIINAPELRNIMDRYIDYIPMEAMPHIEVPAENQLKHFLNSSDLVAAVMADLDRRKGAVPKAFQRQPGGDTLLAIYTGGRNAAVDPRLYGGEHAGIEIDMRTFNSEDDKLEFVLDGIEAAFKENKEHGHLIFLDNSGHTQVDAGKLTENLHREIKNELTKRGFEAKQIGIMNGKEVTNPNNGNESSVSGEKKDKRKQELADLYNDGKIKVLIGTTASMGEGMDLQVKTKHIWNLDIPYTPGAFRQRHGRGVRYGNENDVVITHLMLMRGSFDNLSLNIVMHKKGWNEALWEKDVDREISTEEEMVGGAMPSSELIAIEMETDPVKKELLKLRFDYDRMQRERSNTRDMERVFNSRLSRAYNSLNQNEKYLAERQEKLANLTPDDKIKDEEKRQAQYDKSKAFLEKMIDVANKNIDSDNEKIRNIQKQVKRSADELREVTNKIAEFETTYFNEEKEISLTPAMEDEARRKFEEEGGVIQTKTVEFEGVKQKKAPKASAVEKEMGGRYRETLNPKAAITQFLRKKDTLHKNESGALTNGKWALEGKFVPKELKNIAETFDIRNRNVKYDHLYDTVVPNAVKSKYVFSFLSKSGSNNKMAVFLSDKGNYVAFPEVQVSYLQKIVPKFSLMVNDNSMGAVIMSGNEIAGFLMPSRRVADEVERIVDLREQGVQESRISHYKSKGIGTAQQVDEEWLDTATEMLHKAVGGIAVVKSTKMFDARVASLQAQGKIAKGRAPLGFYDPETNKIYIDVRRMNKDTVFHEFAHPVMNYLRVHEPELYAHGIALIKGTRYAKNAQDAGYSDYLDEALVQAIGEKGAEIHGKQKHRFLAWLKRAILRLSVAFKKLVGVPISLDEFSSMVAYRMQGRGGEFWKAGKTLFGDSEIGKGEEEKDVVDGGGEKRDVVDSGEEKRDVVDVVDRIDAGKATGKKKDRVLRSEGGYAPVYFSEAERVVERRFPKSMKAGAVRNWLVRNGVKDAELAWIDLDGFLAGKNDVSKDELLGFVARNKVTLVVEDVTRKYGKEVFDDLDDRIDLEEKKAEALQEIEYDTLAEVGSELDLNAPYYHDLFYHRGDASEDEVQADIERLGVADEDELYDLFDETYQRIYDERVDELEKRLEQEVKIRGQYEGENFISPMPYEGYREILIKLPMASTFTIGDNEEMRRLENLGNKRTAQDDAKLEDLKEKFSEDEKPTFTHGHWSDDVNVLMHVRFTERQQRRLGGADQFNLDYDNWVEGGKIGEKPSPSDYEGKDNRILLIEEVQSDWHQKGKKEGYGDNPNFDVEYYLEGLTARISTPMSSVWDVYDRDGNYLMNVDNADTEADAIGAAKEKLVKYGAKATDRHFDTVPDAPFKDEKAWSLLGFKYVLRYAAENGFDYVAWTTGVEQVRRYEDMTRRLVDRIEWYYHEDKITIHGEKNGLRVFDRDADKSELGDILGKNMAKQILDSGDKKGVIEGDSLVIGGEGMVEFYDRKLPSYFGKFVKQFGGEVSRLRIWAGRSQAEEGPPVHAIRITDAMRKTALYEGFPQFQYAGQGARTADSHTLLKAKAMERHFGPLIRRANEEKDEYNALMSKVMYGEKFSEEEAKRLDIVAESQTRRDMTIDRIRRETGWFRGLDGKWRFEIPDGAFKLRARGQGWEKADAKTSYFVGKLSDVVTHYALFQAYPELKNYKVDITIYPTMAREATNGGFNHVTKGMKVVANDAARAEEILLHEVQHAIQHIEGFARGGRVEFFLPSNFERMFSAYKKLKNRALELVVKRDKAKSDKDRRAIQGQIEKMRKRIYQLHNKLVDINTRAMGQYTMLAGEIEARDVVLRRWFDDDRRSALTPYTTDSNVVMRWEEVIVRYHENGDASFSMLTEKSPQFQYGGAAAPAMYKAMGRAKAERKPKDEHEAYPEIPSAYEKLKNDWFGERDWKTQQAWIEAQKIQERIQKSIGKKPTFGSGERFKQPLLTTWEKKWHDIDEAIHLYIDMKRNPEHREKFWDTFTDEQRRLIGLAENLTDEQKQIAEDISKLYQAIGVESMDEGVIHNVLENYVNRIYDFDDKQSDEYFRKFGTTTRHAKQRVFGTIMEAWSHGYQLKIHGATNNLAILKAEMANVIEHKRLIREGMRLTMSNGSKLFSFTQGVGSKRIDHPNFSWYTYRGSVRIDWIKVRLERIADMAAKAKTGKASGPMEKLVTVTKEALMARGMSENEATVVINKLQSATSGNEEKKKEIQRVSERIEGKNIDETKFVPKLGKNFVITADGAILRREPLYAPNDVADELNRILGQSKLKGVPSINTITNYNAAIKAMILQTSLFHHLAFSRSYLFGAALASMKNLNIISAYKKGLRAVQEMTPEIELLVRNGLTIGRIQDWDELATYYRDRTDNMMKKMLIPKAVREKIITFQERQAHSLFNRFGAGLKAYTALLEYRNLLKKEPQLSPDERAEIVANLVNDDFGGLHLQRMRTIMTGKQGRDQTVQHIFRLFALAPDWTESNIRSMVKAIKAGSAAERRAYQQFWARTMWRGIFLATVMPNVLLAYWDRDDDEDDESYVDRIVRRYKTAWDKGWLRWLEVDITPLYRLLGGGKENRAYFSTVGHFRDPIKFIFPNAPDGKFDINPFVAMHHKGSVIYRMFFEIATGRNWKGRPFTHWDELLGLDDESWAPHYKGVYKTSSAKHGFRKGDDKGGKLQFSLTKSQYEDMGWHPVGFSRMPSYLLAQARGSLPVQFQNMFSFMMGELDAFESIGKSLGFQVSVSEPNPNAVKVSDKEKKKKRLVRRKVVGR